MCYQCTSAKPSKKTTKTSKVTTAKKPNTKGLSAPVLNSHEQKSIRINAVKMTATTTSKHTENRLQQYTKKRCNMTKKQAAKTRGTGHNPRI